MSCASQKKTSQTFLAKPNAPTYNESDFVTSTSEEVLIDNKTTLVMPGSLLAKSNGRLDLVYSKKIYDWWINYFTKRAPNTFKDHMSNAFEVKSVVQKILAKHGIPIEVFYLGLIESGYNAKIKSKAKATGPWQFMKKTAIHYDLRVDEYLDERYSLYKSTEAAAKYLADLYNIFGNWELALCGYNAGEYRVMDAIRRGNSRDYRELVSQGLLPKETIYYIPKIIAARDIYLHPERYKMFYEKRNGKIFENVVSQEFDRSIGLKTLSKKLNISRGLLIALNPDLKYQVALLKPGQKIRLYFPEEYKVTKLQLNRIPASSLKTKAQTFKIYVASKNEKIKEVARRHGVNFTKLVKYNGFSTTKDFKLKEGQRLRIPI